MGPDIIVTRKFLNIFFSTHTGTTEPNIVASFMPSLIRIVALRTILFQIMSKVIGIPVWLHILDVLALGEGL